MTEIGSGPSVTRARQEHLVPGREIHVEDLRGRQFCEVGLITGAGEDNAVANVCNTTGACDPTAEQVDALDADALARENGAQRAWIIRARMQAGPLPTSVGRTRCRRRCPGPMRADCAQRR
jgi:hypothetical protein